MDGEEKTTMREESLRLCAKGYFLIMKYYHGRAAGDFAMALSAAEQLSEDEDCLVKAYLKTMQMNALTFHSLSDGITQADADAARHIVFKELLHSALATLLRRNVQDSLQANEYETAWHMSLGQHLYGVPMQPGAVSGLGHQTFVDAAMVALETALYALAHDAVQKTYSINPSGLFQFVADAVELMSSTDPTTNDGRPAPESNHEFAPGDPEVRLLKVLARPSVSDVLLSHQELAGAAALIKTLKSAAPVLRIRSFWADMADAVAQPNRVVQWKLRTCQLGACGKVEVHPTQFKVCSACSGVAYCCKEHQVADWPAHKAACKAARRRAAEAATASSGGGGAEVTPAVPPAAAAAAAAEVEAQPQLSSLLSLRASSGEDGASSSSAKAGAAAPHGQQARSEKKKTKKKK